MFGPPSPHTSHGHCKPFRSSFSYSVVCVLWANNHISTEDLSAQDTAQNYELDTVKGLHCLVFHVISTQSAQSSTNQKDFKIALCFRRGNKKVL